jgi:DivIVA domain-containing protein
MGQLLLFIVVALVVAAIVFGVTVMMGGGDPGLSPVEPDGRALPLPSDRPLGEDDVFRAKFDTAVRGYRMSQVDQALQRAAYDIGYKTELIGVLEAEVTALREGRLTDADTLRKAREAAIAPAGDPAVPAEPAPIDITPEPITPSPATSSSAASAPATSGPATPASATPASAASVPAAPASAASVPATSAPGASALATPAPVPDDKVDVTPEPKAEGVESVERR